MLAVFATDPCQYAWMAGLCKENKLDGRLRPWRSVAAVTFGESISALGGLERGISASHRYNCSRKCQFFTLPSCVVYATVSFRLEQQTTTTNDTTERTFCLFARMESNPFKHFYRQPATKEASFGYSRCREDGEWLSRGQEAEIKLTGIRFESSLVKSSEQWLVF